MELAPSFAITATKSASNPTFDFDAIPEGSVHKVGSTYYCVIQTDWPTSDWQFGLATAAAITGPWSAYGGNPIYTIADVSWWSPIAADQIYAPELHEHDGTWYLFYSIADGTTGANGRIGVATASAITGPYTDHGSAILSEGAAGAWDSLRVSEPTITYRDGLWALFYMGETTAAAFGASEKIGVATATDILGPYTKYVNNPILGFGPSGAWDDVLVADPHVEWYNGFYWMLYAGGGNGDGSGTRPWSTGLAYAESPTGPWQRYSGNPVLANGGVGAFDEKAAWRGALYQDGDGTFHIVYGGLNNGLAAAKGGNAAITVTSAATSAGVWIDMDRDGFGASAADSDAPLTRMLPEGSSSVSDNITTYVTAYSITRGATGELTGAAPTDSATITVKNSTGYFNPDNAASPFYNRLGPGCPVWIGVNDDGTVTGDGHDVYGRFAGVVREVAPIPSGAGISATAEIICDGILADYALTPAVVADSTSRSQLTFRSAVLDAMGESPNRRDLDYEPDPLPLSSADSTNALSVLEDLNRANGTRHFIAAANNRDAWYFYTTRNRHHKLGAAADESLDAGSDHVTSVDGWRLNNDGIINSQRASIDPISFTPATATVWEYEQVPFGVAGNLVIWANFDDYVANPTLSVNVASGSITSSITPFGRSAKIELSSTGAEVSELSIEGSQVVRDSAVTLSGDYVTEAAPSQARYRVRAGSDLSGDLLGAQATAQGMVDHIIWRFAPRPLKRPSMTVVNWIPEMFTLNPYDLIAATIASVSASGVKFDIVGLTETCDMASETGPTVHHEITYQLQESRIQGTMDWFVLDNSALNGPDPLGY